MKERCIYCGSEGIIKKGKRKNKYKIFQQYHCKNCRKIFVLKPLKNKTYNVKIILDSLNFYNQGYSLKISADGKIKELLGYSKDISFYDWVIVCSYYSIFHSTQALLGTKRIKINNRLHYATLIAFAKQFIINKELEEELFLIYEDAEEKARELLEIFEKEKEKRGKFQYHRLSRSNIEPAKKSIENAKMFLDSIEKVLANKKII
ncbi:MAG: hypothetical protein KKG75_01950 [Nanoarchaeota archaeon]|nr:hypothetical protein [Nanoarchaeota archaeon]